MKCKPEYANNIIVGVIYRDKFTWYITERDLWILDAEKRKGDYIKSGYGYIIHDNYFSFRFNIPIVNEDTIEVFLLRIADFKIESRQLKELLYNKDYDSTILELAPSLLVDFDKKTLYSSYPETLPFERYVPNGWKGKYGDFSKHIPKEEKYWIFDSIDYIRKVYDEEIKAFNKD